jgi:hypothetical protein
MKVSGLMKVSGSMSVLINTSSFLALYTIFIKIRYENIIPSLFIYALQYNKREKSLLNLTVWQMEQKTVSNKLSATLRVSVIINYILSLKSTTVFALLDMRIQIIHRDHNLSEVLTWVGRMLIVHFICRYCLG